MKKTLLKFEEQKISNINAIKGGTKKEEPNTEEHNEMDDDETKQAKNRRVTFVLL